MWDGRDYLEGVLLVLGIARTSIIKSFSFLLRADVMLSSWLKTILWEVRICPLMHFMGTLSLSPLVLA